MRNMKCPYCNHIFKLNQEQLINNCRFKCPRCHRYNEGSWSADKDGVLIGISKEDYKSSTGRYVKC